MMKRLFLLSFVLCLASVAALQADTVQIMFTGQCSDCNGKAQGILTVTNFTPDSVFTLNLDDFVSFSYNGTNLLDPFVLNHTNVTAVSGALGPAYPGTYDVQITAAVGTPTFISFSDGNWALSSGQGPDDFGTNSSYSLAASSVPEPGTGFLFLTVGVLVPIWRRARLPHA